MTVRILVGDVREQLRALPSESVHCCVTSPPYWGLRSYIADGDARKHLEIGLEADFGTYVATIVDVFREVRRVLRKDGTCWINLGDSYNAATWSGRNPTSAGKHGYWENPAIKHRIDATTLGLKPKDLIGVPWRIAFALQADGWWLRQDIIWHKINPMPESVTDRCTKSHEYLFLLSKSARYYYNAEAIMEPSSPDSHARAARGRSNNHKWADGGPGDQTIAKVSPSAGRIPGVNPKAADARMDGPRSRQNASFSAAVAELVPMRNKRSVWSTSTEPFSEAHFATFPPALIEPCILAGCPVGGVVLDPFGGAGTTGLVADRLQRDAVLIELSETYAAMARRRISGDAPLFSAVAAE